MSFNLTEQCENTIIYYQINCFYIINCKLAKSISVEKERLQVNIERNNEKSIW